MICGFTFPEVLKRSLSNLTAVTKTARGPCHPPRDTAAGCSELCPVSPLCHLRGVKSSLAGVGAPPCSASPRRAAGSGGKIQVWLSKAALISLCHRSAVSSHTARAGRAPFVWALLGNNRILLISPSADSPRRGPHGEKALLKEPGMAPRSPGCRFTPPGSREPSRPSRLCPAGQSVALWRFGTGCARPGFSSA